jgi:hypothetical protein
LCERWVNIESGLEFAIAPGVSCGQFDSKIHKFNCLYWPELREALAAALDIITKLNPTIKIILTVSPVPLTATYKDQNVLISTVEAKSNLRAVAGFVSKNRANVDYFPSFEIISSFPYRGVFYQPNLRQVNQAGVDLVMRHFFTATNIMPNSKDSGEGKISDLLCEEHLLEAFHK